MIPLSTSVTEISNEVPGVYDKPNKAKTRIQQIKNIALIDFILIQLQIHLAGLTAYSVILPQDLYSSRLKLWYKGVDGLGAQRIALKVNLVSFTKSYIAHQRCDVTYLVLVEI